MTNLAHKLKSRKFWACVAGLLLGVATLFGLEPDTVTTVAGAVTAVVSLVSYIITEGKVDAAATHKTALLMQEALNSLDKTER